MSRYIRTKEKDMKKTVKIEMTEEQNLWLLKFLNHEWNEEVEYQWRNRESDTSYLEDMLNVYEACLGKTNSFFIALSFENDIKNKKVDIRKLKESNE